MDASFEELLTRKEPLDSELAVYLDKTEHGFQMLRHPLVTTLYSGINAIYNNTLKQQRARLHECMDRGDWEQAIYVYERPYRFDAFSSYWHHLPLEKAADLLLDIWQDTEFPHQRHTEWLRAFRRLSKHSPKMQLSRAALFDDATKSIVIYRGMLPKEGSKRMPYGMSWTLELEKAQWFAKRFNADGVVRQATVFRYGVFGYLVDRGEQEVIVDPKKLLSISDI